MAWRTKVGSRALEGTMTPGGTTTFRLLKDEDDDDDDDDDDEDVNANSDPECSGSE